ncbi:MAG: guanine deaminase [Rhodospirillales bacterium]|nr:guanine deaminase [Rhodospirillales bacterium]
MDQKAIRGSYLTFKADPFLNPVDDCLVYESDGIILIENGQIADIGPASAMIDKIADGVEVTRYEDSLIMAGFIDCHVHYPQTSIIGAFGERLINWLNKYAFVAEQAFKDPDHARSVARVFLAECLRAGTTTSSVFCTVFPQSVDMFFEEAEKLNMRMIAGKVMMDRNAPQALTDTAQRGYDESKALIEKWHGRGRLLYSLTPRYAPTSTPEQMEMTGALWKEHPDTYLQSHLSENKEEVAWVRELFPQCTGYLDVYDHYGLLGDRAIYGHGIHLSEAELQRCHETGTAIAHCPTSNLFLGSGHFNLHGAKQGHRPVRVGLATDLGGGTSFSILQTLNETYKVAQMNGNALSAAQAFYLATRGTAEALCLQDKIGSLAPGMEADLVIFDLKSTPIVEYRMGYAEDIDEILFILMTMGDDRATRATYIAGEPAYGRD